MMTNSWWRNLLLSMARQTPTYRAAWLNRFHNLGGQRAADREFARWLGRGGAKVTEVPGDDAWNRGGAVMKALPSARAYQLRSAIMDMASRLATAERQAAFATAVLRAYPNSPQAFEDKAKWDRGCIRRYGALDRLADAMLYVNAH